MDRLTKELDIIFSEYDAHVAEQHKDNGKCQHCECIMEFANNEAFIEVMNNAITASNVFLVCNNAGALVKLFAMSACLGYMVGRLRCSQEMTEGIEEK